MDGLGGRVCVCAPKQLDSPLHAAQGRHMGDGWGRCHAHRSPTLHAAGVRCMHATCDTMWASTLLRARHPCARAARRPLAPPPATHGRQAAARMQASK